MSTVTITDEQGNKVTIPQSIWSATVEEYGKKKTWPQKGDQYYVLCEEGSVSMAVRFDNDLADKGYFAYGNAYQTKAEAEAVRDRRRAEAAIRKYIRDNGLEEFEPDWSNDVHSPKHQIYYDHMQGVLSVQTKRADQTNTADMPLYSCENDALRVIRDCEAELKVLFGVKE